MNRERQLINDLLEILHIIHRDGAYTDTEAVIETLRECGVGKDDIEACMEGAPAPSPFLTMNQD